MMMKTKRKNMRMRWTQITSHGINCYLIRPKFWARTTTKIKSWLESDPKIAMSFLDQMKEVIDLTNLNRSRPTFTMMMVLQDNL